MKEEMTPRQRELNATIAFLKPEMVVSVGSWNSKEHDSFDMVFDHPSHGHIPITCVADDGERGISFAEALWVYVTANEEFTGMIKPYKAPKAEKKS